MNYVCVIILTCVGRCGYFLCFFFSVTILMSYGILRGYEREQQEMS